ncbi:type 1 glutamine amidotransferase [Streptomyces sp. NBC_01387]|uniref:type 1 glutamine amidotransferase n=1 Tax=unclassified Streptomyces TaxID=2593676 RepID=UPI00325555A4
MSERQVSAPRVLVVQNTPDGGPRRVGSWLRDAGLHLDVVHPWNGDPLPERLGRRALVVLGGGYLPDDDQRAPWLPGTRALVREALDAGIPMLGICLGGQLLAQVAGGTVQGGTGTPECGSTPIRLRAEAAGDPLFQGLPGVVPAIERHVDTITGLPPGSTWLAESDACPHQAFRVGDRAWGVQFHPEAEAAHIAAWDEQELRALGFDPPTLIAAAEADAPLSADVWGEFTRRFAGLVAAGASPSTGVPVAT